MPDSLNGIVDTWNENVWLASNGGGIGTYWGQVRSIGEPVKGSGQTSGIMPFVHVMDGLTPGHLPGIAAARLGGGFISMYTTPKIEEFLENTQGLGRFQSQGAESASRINITDEFMQAVTDGTDFGLRSPKTGEVLRRVDARSLWQRILETRCRPASRTCCLSTRSTATCRTIRKNSG